jgi:hypothetical protein
MFLSLETMMLKRNLEGRLDALLQQHPSNLQQMVDFIGKDRNLIILPNQQQTSITIPYTMYNQLCEYANLGASLVLYTVGKENDKRG